MLRPKTERNRTGAATLSDCCQAKACDLELMAKRHARVLWAVLAINGVMFFVEIIAGLKANSTALLGDSLDMLGDAVAYGSSLFVIRGSAGGKAKSAALKGCLMLVLGAAIFGRAIYQFGNPNLPGTGVMTMIGILALCTNGLCLFLLSSHRDDDINMKSVWVCSRNDIIANVSVLIAAALVVGLRSPLPDLFVGIALSILFMKSAFGVLREARDQLAAMKVNAT